MLPMSALFHVTIRRETNGEVIEFDCTSTDGDGPISMSRDVGCPS
jgi:hypothetical protein